MLLLHPLADQKAEPDIERYRGVADVLLEPPQRVQVTFLYDVRRIDAALEPGVKRIATIRRKRPRYRSSSSTTGPGRPRRRARQGRVPAPGVVTFHPYIRQVL